MGPRNRSSSVRSAVQALPSGGASRFERRGAPTPGNPSDPDRSIPRQSANAPRPARASRRSVRRQDGRNQILRNRRSSLPKSWQRHRGPEDRVARNGRLQVRDARVAGADELSPDREQRELESSGDARLVEDLGKVVLDRLLANRKRRADFAVRQRARDALDDLHLPIRETVRMPRLTASAQLLCDLDELGGRFALTVGHLPAS